MGAEGDQHHSPPLWWISNPMFAHPHAQTTGTSLLSLHLLSQPWLPCGETADPAVTPAGNSFPGKAAGGWEGLSPDPPAWSRRDAQARSAAPASGAAGRAGSRGCCAGRAPRSSGPVLCSSSSPGPAGALGRLGEHRAAAEGAAVLGTPKAAQTVCPLLGVPVLWLSHLPTPGTGVPSV